MNADLEKLFELAVGLAGAEREEFISRHCADPALRHDLELLLAGDRGAGTFLQGAVMDAASSVLQSLALSPGQRLGPYRVVSVIGRGGMGLVYLAERADGKFEQRVAVKVLQFGLGPLVTERLQRECRILASLEHPNIARVLDAEVTQDGLPYFVMEYVDGRAIDQYCDDHILSARDRIRVLLPVCDALHVAHQKLVVHRDLKPDNILVTRQGVPKLLDFGIAKVLSEVPAAAQNTATRVLTPEYASPEQARGEAVTTATDVYSLAGVLYKLLAGRAPHQFPDQSPLAIARAICEEEVPKPSSFRRELAGDVDSILLMALHKDPRRRYRSVDQFGADLERLLEGKPVLARPDTVWYRTGKYVRRHWPSISAAVAVLLALTIGIGVATWQARRAERRFADVRQLADVFLFDFEKSIHDVPGATQARQLLVKTALDYLQRLSREASGDPGLTRELAAAYEKVGDIQGSPYGGNVGDTAGAVRSYQQSVALLRSLQHSALRRQPVEIDLARTLLKLAKVQQRVHDAKSALRNSTDAIALISGFLQQHPGDPSATQQLINCELELARAEQMTGDKQATVLHVRRAVAMQEALVTSLPRDRQNDEALAKTYLAAALPMDIMDDFAEALVYSKKALGAYEQLSAADPGNAYLRRQLMITLTEAANEQAESNGGDKQLTSTALAYQQRAYAIALQEVKDDPANREALLDRVTLGIRQTTMLTTFDPSLQHALAVIRSTLPVAKELVKLDSANAANRLNLAYCYSKEGYVLSKQGKTADAIREEETAENIYKEMAAAAPNDVNILNPRRWNWSILAEAHAERADWKRAHQAYSASIEIAERIYASDPNHAQDLKNLRLSDAKVVRKLAQTQ